MISLCGCGGGAIGGHRGAAPVLRVPARYRTIQAAVNASRAGELVLVAPGVYHQAVTVAVDHPRITIRGTDRNTVILDGGSDLVDGITVNANGVSVENLTIRHYVVNGLVFAPPETSAVTYGAPSPYLVGWRGSYVTAYDNGLYGVYSFNARGGEFDHVYASGNPDSGIYIGQCRSCDALVSDSIVADNGVGYEDTNASGGVTVTGIVSRENRIGAFLDSAIKEAMPPQGYVTFAGNSVLDNDNAHAPTGDQGFAAGIVISGGSHNLIAHNLVAGHRGAGIVVIDADRISGGYEALDNRVLDNHLAGNRVDLALLTSGATRGDCFSGNHPARTVPANLQRRAPCNSSRPLSGNMLTFPANPPQVDFAKLPAPPAQPDMPGPLTAPAGPAGAPAPIAPAEVRTPG